MSTIGERIKARRLELGYSQDELAKKVGYKSRSSINKLELSRSLPARKITQMAKALETTEAYLMGWEDTAPDLMVNDVYIVKCYSKMSEDNKKRLESYAEFLIQQEKEGSDS